MRVAVLGCGPAGLMAAAGAHWAGAESVTVFSRPQKSALYGAQYLHRPIPGYTENPAVGVSYQMWGTPEDYRRKVYGASWDGTVSPEDLATQHDGWDIRQTYEALWARYGGDQVVPINFSMGNGVPIMYNITQDYDMVLSSVPAPVICIAPQHKFTYTEVWACGETQPDGPGVLDFVAPSNTVICSGREEHPWYRISHIYGYATVEWPYIPAAGRPFGRAVLVRKPLTTNCDCWPKVVRVGRFGRWQKGVLSDSSWHEAVDAVDARAA